MLSRARTRRLALAALLVVVSATAPVAAAETSPTVHDSKRLRVESFTLGNGMEVYLYEDHTVPIVTSLLAYRVGSRDEPIGKRGMAHLMEHMMFKGTAEVGPEEFARIVQSVGGVMNAFTATDYVGYWNKVPSSQLELVFRLEADRMENLVITKEKLDSEREVVKEEYRSGVRDNPYGMALQRVQELVLEGTPYAWTPHGYIEELDEITVGDLRDFYRTHYVPNKAVLVVAGDADRQTVERLAGEHFGDIAPAEVPPQPEVELEFGGSGPRVERLPFSVQLPAAIGGYILPGVGDPDRPALEVLGLLLSGGESSRLNRELVREQRLALAAIGVPLFYGEAGMFVTQAIHLPSVPPDTVGAALRSVLEEAAHEPPSAAELEKARNQLALQQAMQHDSLDGIAMAIAESVIMTGDSRLFRDGITPFLDVTEDDVTRVAETYLRPERLVLVRLTPEGQGDR